MNWFKDIHTCDVCNKKMKITSVGYIGKPIISKTIPKYSKGKSDIQTLCHLHYDEVLIRQGRHPNRL